MFARLDVQVSKIPVGSLMFFALQNQSKSPPQHSAQWFVTKILEIEARQTPKKKMGKGNLAKS